jgi:broad specificity phosphatase PhoE
MRNPATAPHGGETIPAVMERVKAWIAERGKDSGHTVAVTHASVIRAAIVYAIEADLRAFWRIDVVPLSRTDLRTNGRRWVLRSLAPLAPPGEE